MPYLYIIISQLLSRKKLYGIRNMMAQSPNTWWGDNNISHEFGVFIIFPVESVSRSYCLSITRWRCIACGDVIRLKL
jgi:hypothetical protein